MQLKTLQEEFVQALLNSSKKKNVAFREKWLKETPSIPAQDHLDYCLESTMRKLIKNISQTYALCKELSGTKNFHKIVKKFIQQYPPQHGCFFYYGADFSKFVESIRNEEIPYFKDMADYEWSIHQATHAPNESYANQDTLGSFTETSFLNFPLKLCTHVQIVQSIFPLMEIADFLHQSSDESFEYEEEQHYILIYRYNFEVMEEEISQTFYEAICFLLSKEKGGTVSELSNFFVERKKTDQFGPFIQFLFDHQLIKIEA